jgi:hypothetical protein
VCRAKLARLYEVERVRLQLVYEELEHKPQKIVEKLVGIHGVPKGMLMELVRYGKVSLPCRLTPILLSQICDEVSLFSGQIKSEEDLRHYFPVLCDYLDTYPMRGLAADANLFEQALSVIERIEQTFKRGEQYEEMYRPFVEQLAHLMFETKEEPIDEHMQEILSLTKSTRQLKGLEEESETVSEKPIPKSSTLLKKFAVFQNLAHYHQHALEAFGQFEKVKALLLQSATLPPGESDLLMRYQTTLERRLSGAMGELLALEKQGNL